MQRRMAIRLVAALPWMALVAGCGQKGPLYHPPEPDPPEPEEAEEDERTSAAPRAAGSRPA